MNNDDIIYEKPIMVTPSSKNTIYMGELEQV
jgi:hypothetical protein